jgi:hypothetical protein
MPISRCSIRKSPIKIFRGSNRNLKKPIFVKKGAPKRRLNIWTAALSRAFQEVIRVWKTREIECGVSLQKVNTPRNGGSQWIILGWKWVFRFREGRSLLAGYI